MLIATQTPDPKNNNKIDIKKIVKNNSGIFKYCFFLKLTK
jgi:hypothetical protein